MIRWTLSLVLIAACGARDAQCFQDSPAPIGPTEFHKVLMQDVGVWDAELKIFSDPANPETPVVARGVETNTALGEYWLVSNLEFELNGARALGHGIYGYDPITKKCVGSWWGSQNPFASQLIGEYVAGNRTYYYKMSGRDPSGNESSGRLKITCMDDDHRTLEMFLDTGEGETRWMEILLERRKEAELNKAPPPAESRNRK